ncbi:hypothetical protein DRO24_03440, partial [Candidatus Bathyarchaeota archaeon]
MSKDSPLKIGKVLKKKISIISLFALVSFVFLISQAEAVQIKKIYSGSVDFGAADFNKKIWIDTGAVVQDGDNADDHIAVDTSKSIVLISWLGMAVATDTYGAGFLSGEFYTDKILLVARQEVKSAGTVKWQVIEFTDGVNVQAGVSIIPEEDTERLTSLPSSVDLNKAFMVVYPSAGKVKDIEGLVIKGEFVDASTMKFERSTPKEMAFVNWQAVEFLTDVNIQSGTATIPNGATTSGAISITSVDPNKSFLIFSSALDGNPDPDDALIRGSITDNGATITFNRTGNVGNVTIPWFVIEFTDESSTVQAGSITLPSGTVSDNVTLTEIDLSRAFPIRFGTGGGSKDMGSAMIAAELTTTTNLALSRAESATGTDAYIDWQAVELSPLTLTSPNGGEVWQVGDTQNITWLHADSLLSGGSCTETGYEGHHLVNLLLSTDGGSTYPLTIATGVRGTQDSYSWTIPATIDAVNLIGTNLKVRIIDTDLSTRNYDSSNGTFEIKGTLTLTAPNGGEIWYIDDTDRYITWDYTGELATVSLYYDTNSGADGYPHLIASGVSVGSGGSGSYNWSPIPDLPYKTMRVKVENEADTSVYDTSDDDFIIRPKITITAPNLGTEVWPAQTDQSIEWTTTGTVDSVNIYYSTNTGVDWTLIVSDYTSGSSYTWTVPVEAIGDQTKIKVEKSDDSVIMDTAPDGGSGVFSIVPSIKVTSPTSGTEVWRVGETHDITWEINGTIDYVKIEYSTDGGSTYPVDNLIVDSTPASDLTYPWTIPDNISDNVVVKISNVDDPSMYDESDNPFKIKGKIVVTEPNGGETYTVGSSQVIKWQKYGTLGDVNIKYSTDGGTTFPNTIATVLASDLNYTWSPIPDDITDTARIKIELVDDPAGVFDTSDADFYIKGSLSLTAPNGGEIFYVGDPTDISWTYTGTIGNVELRYSTDGGVTFPDTKVIVSGIAPDSSPYSWTIPDDISGSVRVKILLVSDPTVNDISDGDFSIKGNLVLTAPNGGEEWEVETYQNITWDRLGESLGYVKLEY